MHPSEGINHSRALEARALEECNRERIEIPGRIQSHGALVAFDFHKLHITYASSNLSDFVHIQGNIFRLSLLDLFPSEDVHAIVNTASHRSALGQREHVKVSSTGDRLSDISLFRTGDQVVLELVPIAEAMYTQAISRNVKWVISQAHAFQEIDDILQKTVDSLQKITGFSRVMAYRFLPDDSGEVIAESRDGTMDSYLGLRFPASDIPSRARDLFLKNPIRLIESTSDEGVPIMAASDSLPDLDLTFGILRAVSPIHNQYLRNMGVLSSLTIPIVIEGRLWGLFAHHHGERIPVPPEVAYSAEIIGQTVSMAIEHNIRRETDHRIKQLLAEGRKLIPPATAQDQLQAFWAKNASILQNLINSDGIAYCVGEAVLTQGYCPSEATIIALEKNSKETEALDVGYSTDLASKGFDGLHTTTGYLRIPIGGGEPSLSLLYFRNEVTTQINWAGNPDKEIEVIENKVRLHPRSSFEDYKQLHQGTSDEWSSEELSAARLISETLSTFRETDSERELRQRGDGVRLEMMVRELNHRVRNILTLVRSISRQTAYEEKTISSYLTALEKRINALADAHELLTEDNLGGIGLREVLEKELQPYRSAFSTISLFGPEVPLNEYVLPIMVLVLHELTTNAVKYGALSQKGGTLEVGWLRNSEGLRLSWVERDGPPIKQRPIRSGFGQTVIEHAISYEFGGTTRVDFQESGLQAEFFIPAQAVFGSASQRRSGNYHKTEDTTGNISEDATDSEWSILVLEDDFVNAMELKETLHGLGFTSVITFSVQEEALASLDLHPYRLAILDVHLGEGTSEILARECQARGIGLCYLTGDREAINDKSLFPRARVALKPVDPGEIHEIISELLFDQTNGREAKP